MADIRKLARDVKGSVSFIIYFAVYDTSQGTGSIQARLWYWESMKSDRSLRQQLFPHLFRLQLAVSLPFSPTCTSKSVVLVSLTFRC